jgi:cytochrome P450
VSTTTPGITAPVLDADPFDESTLVDPDPMHELLRETAPVTYLERYRVWAMARYEHVHAALTDHDTFCSGRGAGLTDFRKEKPWRSPSLLLEADPPDHTVVRTAMSTVISSPTVRQFRETFRVACVPRNPGGLEGMILGLTCGNTSRRPGGACL